MFSSCQLFVFHMKFLFTLANAYASTAYVYDWKSMKWAAEWTNEWTSANIKLTSFESDDDEKCFTDFNSIDAMLQCINQSQRIVKRKASKVFLFFFDVKFFAMSRAHRCVHRVSQFHRQKLKYTMTCTYQAFGCLRSKHRTLCERTRFFEK